MKTLLSKEEDIECQARSRALEIVERLESRRCSETGRLVGLPFEQVVAKSLHLHVIPEQCAGAVEQVHIHGDDDDGWFAEVIVEGHERNDCGTLGTPRSCPRETREEAMEDAEYVVSCILEEARRYRDRPAGEMPSRTARFCFFGIDVVFPITLIEQAADDLAELAKIQATTMVNEAAWNLHAMGNLCVRGGKIDETVFQSMPDYSREVAYRSMIILASQDAWRFPDPENFNFEADILPYDLSALEESAVKEKA